MKGVFSMVDAINSINGANVNPALTSGTQVPTRFQQKLLALGVPQATIDQGKQAIHSYIEANPAIKQALQAEKQQKTIFQPQQGSQNSQGLNSANQSNKSSFEQKIAAEVASLKQQNPSLSDAQAKQQAIQNLIAQFKSEQQQPQMSGGCSPCRGCGGCGKKC